MELIHIATGHAFEVLGALSIIASLLFTAFELRHVAAAQRVNNLIQITKQQREILSNVFDHPHLARVLDPKADVAKLPVTTQESILVTFLILHLNASFQAMQAKMLVTPQGLRRDIRCFFELPVPKAVWNGTKNFQDAEFVNFVDSCFSDDPISTIQISVIDNT